MTLNVDLRQVIHALARCAHDLVGVDEVAHGKQVGALLADLPAARCQACPAAGAPLSASQVA